MSKSLIDNCKVCFVCGTVYGLHKHHIFGGANRNKSEKDGCWCYLCGEHHNLSNKGVHFNKELDTRLKQTCQQLWMTKKNKTVEDFIKEYGRNYL